MLAVTAPGIHGACVCDCVGSNEDLSNPCADLEVGTAPTRVRTLTSQKTLISSDQSTPRALTTRVEKEAEISVPTTNYAKSSLDEGVP